MKPEIMPYRLPVFASRLTLFFRKTLVERHDPFLEAHDQDHPASYASDVKYKELINKVRPAGSLGSAARTTMPCAVSKDCRFEEEEILAQR